MPDQLGVTLEGKPFQLKDYLGKQNLYLVFWTVSCPACRAEIPNLIDSYQSFKNMEFAAINPGAGDSLGQVKHYAEKFRLPYPVIYDETSLSAKAFDIYGVPTAILINKKGEVIYQGFPPRARDLAKIFQEN